MNSLKRILTITSAIITFTGATTFSAINVSAVSKMPVVIRVQGQTFFIDRPQEVKRSDVATGIRLPANLKPGTLVKVLDEQEREVAVFQINDDDARERILISPRFEAGQSYGIQLAGNRRHFKAERIKLPAAANFLKEDEQSKQR
ncbi:hypothetical protein [Xylocopilactobacillus apicola]|uniref:Uncharacterized protein n=1 Tax=Xylocopilactobacillus apicola TaxID=2932184 RepID=A0AAU9D015_9LACO|nr:hypothetical protein [Xylocopilactobacillus apicola]BDR59617.1 hypothetical protein XA3_20580 [Xylocopilactobacillus apicola]